MSIYFIIIIGIIVFQYLLSFVVKILNIKALDPNLPKEFEETFDQDKYTKSQEYTKTNTRFSFFTSTFSLIINLSFIFGGVYNIIDLYVRDFGYSHEIAGLCFFGLLFVINDFLNIPFSIYKTFVIEEKYGFNKTTIKTFIMDKIKGELDKYTIIFLIIE